MDNLILGSSIRDIYIRWTADVSTAGIENTLRAFASSADSVRTFRSADTQSHALFLNVLSHTLPRISKLILDPWEIGPNVSILSLRQSRLFIYRYQSVYEGD
jgi:hypothetical protein